MSKAGEAIAQLPDGWDMLYFGAWDWDKNSARDVSPALIRPGRPMLRHAVLHSPRGLLKLALAFRLHTGFDTRRRQMIEQAKEALSLVDHAASQPPLWWLGLFILLGVLMLAAFGWFINRRMVKLEAGQKAAQALADKVRDSTEKFLKEQLSERKEETAQVVAALTTASEVIKQNNRLLEIFTSRAAEFTGPHSLTMPPR